jgi:ribosomal protein S18 acetylase RimI-like enzyme
LALRTCEDNDLRFCYEAKKAALRCYVEPIWGWDEKVQIDYHRKDWDTQRPEIITLDGKDIGTMEIVRKESGIHLGEFYIFPEFQRQGIGTHFMGLILSEADQRSLPTILEVIKINPVKSLYEKFGFRTTEETKTHYQMKREPNQSVRTIRASSADPLV